MYSFTEENYLKAIYKLSDNKAGEITTNAIADAMQTKAASVTDMVKKLAEKQLLKYEKYKGVKLSAKGRKVAIDTVRKHRLWETFLHNKLNFKWDEVHEIAEQLEHIQSETLIDKLDDFLGYPAHDPHGDPIPGKNGEIKMHDVVTLSNLKKGERCVVVGVVDHRTIFLKHLQKINLMPGSKIQVSTINEFDQSHNIKVNRNIELQISFDVAKNILVKIDS